MAPRGLDLPPEASAEMLDQIPKAKSFLNTDLGSTRNEYLFKPPGFLDRWLLDQLHNERDAPIAYLIFNISTMALPAAICLFFFPNPSHWLGLAYFAINAALFLQRYILCLHYAEHLQPFKNTWAGNIFSQLCYSVLCILYGLPPGVYRLHHVVMHHCENNIFPWDVSSTEPFQRDNFLHFLGYWLRFLAAIAIELPWYAFRRKRYSLALQAVSFIAAHVTIIHFLYQARPVATLWVIIIPFCVTSFALMYGNWSQHIFVDPAQPRNNYTLTYNLVNCPDNQKTFNDGYHIVHHQNSKVHWLDLPVRFMETLDKHAAEDALVFKGIGFFDVGIFVFTGQLGALADRYVNIGQKPRSKEELIELFRSRLKPVKQGGKQA